MDEIFSDEIYEQMSAEYEKVLGGTSFVKLALHEKKPPFTLKNGGELLQIVSIAGALKDALYDYDIKQKNYDCLCSLYTIFTGETPSAPCPAKYSVDSQLLLIKLLQNTYQKYAKSEHSPTILLALQNEIIALFLIRQ